MTDQPEIPKYLIPQILPEAAEFWAGTVRGELRIQRCIACGLHQHYPRSVCSHCGVGTLDAGTLEWVTAAGTGTVHSFTVIRQHGIPPFRTDVPFVVALVDLDEAGTVPAGCRLSPRRRASAWACGRRSSPRPTTPRSWSSRPTA